MVRQLNATENHGLPGLIDCYPRRRTANQIGFYALASLSYTYFQSLLAN